MISVATALEIIGKVKRDFGVENISLEKAPGRVLREFIRADRPFPPFNRVAMDGIAVSWEAIAAGHREFLIKDVQIAGAPQMVLGDIHNCIQVMTGAVCPEGADTVIRVEDLEIWEGDGTRTAQIKTDDLRAGQNVHKMGIDRSEGDELIPAGRILTPAEVAVAASVGAARLTVSQLPRMAVVSTGDELVPVKSTPLPHQIRQSNGAMLASIFAALGIKAQPFHFPDREAILRSGLEKVLETHDVVILSGGVSMGELDFVPQVLEQLGVEKHFHRVQQRPGKPFWFGCRPNGAVVFGLPGNPVSAFVGAYRYIRPWLLDCLQVDQGPQPRAILAEDFHFRPDLTYFLTVRTHFDEKGRLMASPLKGKGSGDFANLLDCDAFLELPSGQTDFPKGSVFPCFFFR